MTLRERFHLYLFAIPSVGFVVVVFTMMIGLPDVVCVSLFIFIFAFLVFKTSKIKCPKCKLRLWATYNVYSKYYLGAYHKVPENCPCCGQSLDVDSD